MIKIFHLFREALMELRNLRTFQMIVDQGSYQKAAEMLGYTQSTVTAQIQQLEKELGIPLFERIGRRMVLTEFGQNTLEKARTLLQLSDELLYMRKSEGVSGVLRVDMAETLLCYRMQPVLREFRTKAPQVKLIIRSPNYLKIAENVRNGSCDLGVGYSMDWHCDPFVAEDLGVAHMALLASPDFPQYDFDTPNQELAATFVTDEPDSNFRTSLEAYFRRKDIKLEHTMELWSIETIKRCVVSNLGFTYLPRFIAKAELESGLLREIPFSMTDTPSQVLCIRHKNHFLSPAMELFITILREHMLGQNKKPSL